MKRSYYLGLFFCMYQFSANAVVTESQIGFVSLPDAGKAGSAYVTCDTSSNFGLSEKSVTHNIPGPCSISSAKLIESPMNAPISEFTLVGIISRGVPIPEPYAAPGNDEFATLTDTIWHNEATKECIFGTHVLMKDQTLANGKRWEINDIVRGGFAGRPVQIAYFVRPTPSHDYGMPETLFRVGRTYTSVPYGKSTSNLPPLKEATGPNKAISKTQVAAFNENWVDFTTDISFDDADGVTRKMTSMLYIKTTCEQREPEEKECAIRLRTTSGTEKDWLEIDVPGLVPAGASVN
jgi:hypothetical protein